QKGENETADEANILDEYFARKKRLSPLQEILRQMYEASWEAEVLLDKNISKLIAPLEESFKELFASIEAYFHTRYNQTKHKQGYDISQELLQSHYKIVYGTVEDEKSKTVDASTNALVERLKG